MGKVRPDNIKRTCRELITKYPGVFTADFEKNKELLEEYTIINSKHVRNRIAGYLVNLVKIEQKKTEKAVI